MFKEISMQRPQSPTMRPVRADQDTQREEVGLEIIDQEKKLKKCQRK